VEKCEIIANSNPFFQYNQPKIIPPIPFNTIALIIIIGVISTTAEVIGR
jgi:hypothetical protein